MLFTNLKINKISNLYYSHSKYFSIQKSSTFQSRQIQLNDSAQYILKRYRQNQGWVYINPPLFQWFKHSIRQTLHGNINKFKEILKVTSIIHISKYDSWRMLHQISLELNKLLNFRNFTTKNTQSNSINTIDLLKLAKNFNYQFQQNQDQNFIQQLKQKTSKIKNQHQLWQFSQLFQIGLSQNKILKLIEGKKLQILIKKMIAKQNLTNRQQFKISNIIKEGLISQIWSDQFLQQMLYIIQKRYKNSQKIFLSTKKYIKFVKFDQFQNQLQLGSRISLLKNSQTQDKIRIILHQLNYDIVFDNKIFDFELDYTLGKKFIIQYNGIHHYTINSYKPIQTARSKWKRENLQKRGFKVHVIPFFQWKQLDNINKMKKYIITQIQNFIINRSKEII